jgi:imidazolonepropionase-like amidohydrolase
MSSPFSSTSLRTIARTIARAAALTPARTTTRTSPRTSPRTQARTQARTGLLLGLLAALLPLSPLVEPAEAQRLRISNGVRQGFVSVDHEVVALRGVRVIDGTGAAPAEGQTVLLANGRIAAVGPSGSVPIPEGAEVLELPGHTVIPGLVMMHEHLYYPTGGRTYGNLGASFAPLYLAGGVTAMRTGGNMNGYGEIGIRDAIERGDMAGPWVDATAPYLEMPGLGFPQMYPLKDAEDARRMVGFWADAGATSFKAYMNITRDALAAAIDEAHRRGLRVTGHLCSVTLAEAAALGIDAVEHAFFAATDFVDDKTADRCPGQGTGQAALNTVDPETDPRFAALVETLVSRGVALTSTLTVFETYVPGRPLPRGLEVLTPQLKELYEARHESTARNTRSVYSTLYPRASAMEVAFFRAGGLLVAGTDPTGGGGVIPGFSNQRAVELLVEAGLTPLEAIQVVTLNGARALGRESEIGSIAVGKQADLVVLQGDPSARTQDIRNVRIVFRQGVGFDPERLVASVAGRVGLF